MSTLKEKEELWPEYAMYYRMAPVTAVVASFVLLISLIIFIWTIRGLFLSRKAKVNHTTPPNATKEPNSNAVDSSGTESVVPSQCLENLSVLTIICFTICNIAYFPTSLLGTYFDRDVVRFWVAGVVLTYGRNADDHTVNQLDLI